MSEGQRQGCEPPFLSLGRLLAGDPAAPGVDWPGVLALARRHSVSPILFWRLRQRGEDARDGVPAAVPAGVWEALRADFFGAAARRMVVERQLARVLAAVEEAGVPILVVKGPAAGAFYPHPAMRTYGDLDVLVPEDRLGAAEAALNGLGYRAVKPQAWMLDHYHHLALAGDDDQLVVEVHWRLDIDEQEGIPNYAARLPGEDLWARAEPWTVGGQPALRLEAVDAVLHLCRHAVMQHRLRMGLRPVCDLAQVVEDWGAGQWQVLAARAGAYGLGRPVCLMLSLAAQVLGVAVPPEVVQALRPPEPLPKDLVERVLARDGDGVAPVPVAVLQAGASPGWPARLRHFVWHLFLPRDGMALAYGVAADSPAIWLTYLWRPVDLLRRYGRGAWSALRGDQAARAAWQHEAWLERWLRGRD